MRFEPVMLKVGGETLVEPQIRPILAGDQVAEPLMRELVGMCVVARRCDIRRPSADRQSAETGSVVALAFSIPPAVKSSTDVCAYCSQGKGTPSLSENASSICLVRRKLGSMSASLPRGTT